MPTRCEFLSTPSARRATSHSQQFQQCRVISIHALREEGDAPHTSTAAAASHFYPRPPRGGRPASDLGPWPPDPISIHALREEGDTYFYSTSTRNVKFLSTPSARRATCSSLTSRRSTTISIHALREEGDCSDTVHHRCCRYFYPRPPRGGRPSVLKTGPRPILYFYPRPPRGGRLTWEIVAAACISISIHALREEGDPRRLRRCLLPCHFYPRPPRGGRPPSGA